MKVPMHLHLARHLEHVPNYAHGLFSYFKAKCRIYVCLYLFTSSKSNTLGMPFDYCQLQTFP